MPFATALDDAATHVTVTCTCHYSQLRTGMGYVIISESAWSLHILSHSKSGHKHPTKRQTVGAADDLLEFESPSSILAEVSSADLDVLSEFEADEDCVEAA